MKMRCYANYLSRASTMALYCAMKRGLSTCALRKTRVNLIAAVAFRASLARSQTEFSGPGRFGGSSF